MAILFSTNNFDISFDDLLFEKKDIVGALFLLTILSFPIRLNSSLLEIILILDWLFLPHELKLSY